MLEELRIQNFAIIDQLTLEFTKGFNVITGETGAGKSILIDAVELLLGGKADSGAVRSGQDKALVEGVFALNDRARALVIPILIEENLIEDESEADFLTISREIRSNGRSSARINGVTCNNNLLQEVGQALVDIHGQHAHMSLFRSRAHMDLLDRYANLLEVREALSQVVANLTIIRDEIKHLQADKDELQRRAERLRYEVEEIEGAKLKPSEEDDLQSEVKRLGSSERIAELTSAALRLLSGDESNELVPVVDALMELASHLDKLQTIDSTLANQYSLTEELAANAQDLALSLSRYADAIEHDPRRLNELEERLELIKKLKRRFHVDTVADILAYAEKAKAELNSLEHSEERLEELRAQEDKTLRHIGELCERMSKVRDVAAGALSKKIVRELADLRMERTQFEVIMEREEDPTGAYGKDGKRYKFDATGMERIEFMMSANLGEPLRPLAKVASGGEAARIMLSIKRVLSQADDTGTLIFDEIDQGIGGRIGSVVGEKLWSLSEGHQVLVVTHLPQLASFADIHFHVSKGLNQKRTVTQIKILEDSDERVKELAAMLGAIGESGEQSARDILEASQQRKLELQAPIPKN